MKKRTFLAAIPGAVAALALGPLATAAQAQSQTLLNASYDVAREFYKDYNAAFTAYWKKTTGKDVRIDQAHGGSSKQARAVSDGLPADVVTMNQATDIDFLASKNMVSADWRKAYPDNAAPTTSTSIFLVRTGNPKNIKDWNDLIRPDVKVVIVNPKLGGNGRATWLAAWGHIKKAGGSDAQAAEFVGKLLKNVAVMDAGGRAATGTFLQRNVGDVLITFESEVITIDQEFGEGKVDPVYPSSSLLVENPVAVVQPVVAKKGTQELAQAYLKFLWSPEAQQIAAKHWLRPRSAEVLKANASRFKPIKLFTVDEVFGSSAKAQETHFKDGGEFDRIYKSIQP
ncbi:sulfate ABC transporter substrate-binding protein [Amphibiibacter pelophylacis]|uniref:Sulfate ABC transporter substrate-binding protein n=1 Tax=Amphibiibacter pelophylacis TaxID=1799477 RepID=A0ACC6NYR3_9BURK